MIPGYHPSGPSVHHKLQVTSIRLDISEKSPSHRIHSCKVKIEEFFQRETDRERETLPLIGVRPGSDTKIAAKRLLDKIYSDE